MRTAGNTPSSRERLAPGPDSDGSARYVAELQRARLLTAMVLAACEHGAANVTVASVVGYAGVSRRTFYELFADCEECLLEALEYSVSHVASRVLPAYETAEGGWPERVGAGLSALLDCLDRQPHVARLLIVEWLGAGAVAVERRQQALARIVEAVDEGRLETKGRVQPPALTAEGVVGGVMSVLHGRLWDRPPRARLVELLDPLMSMILLPYLGAEAASRRFVGALPAPAPSVNGHILNGSLADLDMRVTYRTARALTAIASHPGASNRAIGQAAGIDDQGQISKLLRRLQRLGLVENGSPAESRSGKPNAWSLTDRGEQVERSLRLSPIGSP